MNKAMEYISSAGLSPAAQVALAQLAGAMSSRQDQSACAELIERVARAVSSGNTGPIVGALDQIWLSERGWAR